MRPRGIWIAASLLVVAVTQGALTVFAESGRELTVTGHSPPDSEKAAPTEPPVEAVALDLLLKLPSGWGAGVEKRLGLTEFQWRDRFAEVNRELREAQAELESARGELNAIAGETGAGGQWQIAPPGAAQTELTPLSFKHREQIRKGRERVENARRGQRALTIQADLADVPISWRGTPDSTTRDTALDSPR